MMSCKLKPTFFFDWISCQFLCPTLIQFRRKLSKSPCPVVPMSIALWLRMPRFFCQLHFREVAMVMQNPCLRITLLILAAASRSASGHKACELPRYLVRLVPTFMPRHVMVILASLVHSYISVADAVNARESAKLQKRPWFQC